MFMCCAGGSRWNLSVIDMRSAGFVSHRFFRFVSIPLNKFVVFLLISYSMQWIKNNNKKKQKIQTIEISISHNKNCFKTMK